MTNPESSFDELVRSPSLVRRRLLAHCKLSHGETVYRRVSERANGDLHGSVVSDWVDQR